MNKRKAEPVNVKEYAKQGEILFKAVGEEMLMEIHKVPIPMSRQESLNLIMTMIKVGKQSWGPQFAMDVQLATEVL